MKVEQTKPEGSLTFLTDFITELFHFVLKHFEINVMFVYDNSESCSCERRLTLQPEINMLELFVSWLLLISQHASV